jgi:hypothetical protein
MHKLSVWSGHLSVQVQLRVPENAQLSGFADVLTTHKTACPLLMGALSCVAAEALHVQWLCLELETIQWQPNAPQAELQQCVRFERAAADRIRLFGMPLALPCCCARST